MVAFSGEFSTKSLNDFLEKSDESFQTLPDGFCQEFPVESLEKNSGQIFVVIAENLIGRGWWETIKRISVEILGNFLKECLKKIQKKINSYKKSQNDF